MLAGAVAVMMLAPVASSARTLYVANDGLDEPGCGDQVEPCRSISEAIAQAAPGDRIEVGPGAYGDLNEDGVFDGDGEENAELGPGSCDCMIKVDKPLTITSAMGVGSTVIKIGDSFFSTLSIVRIQSDDVIFGRMNQGFHITTERPLSNSIRGIRAMDTNRTTIQGNLVTRVPLGIVVDGGAGHLIRHNTISNNGGGIAVARSDDIVVSDNVAINNIGIGIMTICTGALLQNNQILQNLRCGIQSDVANVGVGCANPRIINNNIYGNGTQPSQVAGFLNCGFLAQASTITTLPELEGNYWGSADGPGPDPADEAFAADSGSAGPIDVFSFAQSSFRIQGIR